MTGPFLWLKWWILVLWDKGFPGAWRSGRGKAVERWRMKARRRLLQPGSTRGSQGFAMTGVKTRLALFGVKTRSSFFPGWLRRKSNDERQNVYGVLWQCMHQG